MIKVNKTNYFFYKEVFKVIWEFEAKYAKMDPDSEFSPIKVLQNWEKESESLARRGLKEGLRDSLTGLKDLPVDLKDELNKNLISKNLPSLNILTSKLEMFLRKS